MKREIDDNRGLKDKEVQQAKGEGVHSAVKLAQRTQHTIDHNI